MESTKMTHILGCPQGNRDVNIVSKRAPHPCPPPPALKGTLSYTGTLEINGLVKRVCLTRKWFVDFFPKGRL